MAKKVSKCWDCGKVFAQNYLLMLHYELHRGEPQVRAAGCVCGQDYDVRRGSCQACGFIHSTGWRVIDGIAVAK
jgi:ribosomal protein L37E